MNKDMSLDYFVVPIFITVLVLLYYLRSRNAFSSKTVPKDEIRVATFVYPEIKPCSNHLADLKPVPYRPFRWGDYHVTMGIRSISFDSWIEVDNQLPHYHAIRSHRVRTRGDRLVGTLPASEKVKISGHEAAAELADELCEYLSRRYPHIYRVERHGKGSEGWYGEGRIRTITILPVNATYNLDEEDPMKVAGLLIQDDLAIMIEGTDGVYYLRAGAIILPGFWRLEDKIGMSLDDIHLSGKVPQYPTKLKTSMNRFFQRLACDKLIQRNNYHFAAVKEPEKPFEPLDPYEIGWAETMMGKEELFRPGAGLGVHKDESDAPATGHGSEELDTRPEYITLRQERQTLRRLPKTGAIVFTVRTYVEPIPELVREIGVPGRIASAIRSWPEDVAGYKSRDRLASVILPYLDEYHAKQVTEGLIGEDEQPKTDYPF